MSAHSRANSLPSFTISHIRDHILTLLCSDIIRVGGVENIRLSQDDCS